MSLPLESAISSALSSAVRSVANSAADSVASSTANATASSLSGLGTLGSSTPNAFSGVLDSAVEQVNNLQTTAEEKVNGVLTGTGQDIHDAALSVERASLGFDLLLQVRNKVVSAYQEISRLQF